VLHLVVEANPVEQRVQRACIRGDASSGRRLGGGRASIVFDPNGPGDSDDTDDREDRQSKKRKQPEGPVHLERSADHAS